MKSRVSTLDGLRVVAIFMVMFGHYYNFSSNQVLKTIAGYGWIGVPAFFVISGFVIAMSLERSKSYTEFLKKRYIRLAPGMFICSTITFLFFSLIYSGEGYGFSKDPYNYLIANTFIDPLVFDIPYNWLRFYYLDNAYWSLWVEVNFYVIIGFLYFLSPRNMIRNYLILCVIGIPVFLLFSSSIGHKVLEKVFSADAESIKFSKLIGRSVLVFFHECLWFLLGLFVYKLYNDKKQYKYVIYMIATVLILILWQADFIFRNGDFYVAMIFICVLLIYLIFIYKPEYLSFLTNKYICRLGVASYSLYLIHYHIGAATIKQIYKYLGKEVYIIPVFIMLLACSFALLSYKYLETPISNVLKKLLLKKKKATHQEA